MAVWPAQPRRVALGKHILGGLAGATYRVAFGEHVLGGLTGATYRVALRDTFWAAWRGHMLGGLTGATYSVALGRHVLGGLAGATYGAAFRGHVSGGLAGATYRIALGGQTHFGRSGGRNLRPACMCSWRAWLRRDLAAGTLPQSTLLPLIIRLDLLLRRSTSKGLTSKEMRVFS